MRMRTTVRCTHGITGLHISEQSKEKPKTFAFISFFVSRACYSEESRHLGTILYTKDSRKKMNGLENLKTATADREGPGQNASAGAASAVRRTPCPRGRTNSLHPPPPLERRQTGKLLPRVTKW